MSIPPQLQTSNCLWVFRYSHKPQTVCEYSTTVTNLKLFVFLLVADLKVFATIPLQSQTSNFLWVFHYSHRPRTVCEYSTTVTNLKLFVFLLVTILKLFERVFPLQSQPSNCLWVFHYSHKPRTVCISTNHYPQTVCEYVHYNHRPQTVCEYFHYSHRPQTVCEYFHYNHRPQTVCEHFHYSHRPQTVCEYSTTVTNIKLFVSIPLQSQTSNCLWVFPLQSQTSNCLWVFHYSHSVTTSAQTVCEYSTTVTVCVRQLKQFVNIPLQSQYAYVSSNCLWLFHYSHCVRTSAQTVCEYSTTVTVWPRHLKLIVSIPLQSQTSNCLWVFPPHSQFDHVTSNCLWVFHYSHKLQTVYEYSTTVTMTSVRLQFKSLFLSLLAFLNQHLEIYPVLGEKLACATISQNMYILLYIQV